jgi:hypothetical protein
MSKPDSNTDGKGKSETEKKKGIIEKIAALFNDEVEDAADSEPADTSTEVEEELEGDADGEATETETPAEEGITPADDTKGKKADEETEEEEPLPGDDGEKRFTQTDVNNVVQKRLKSQEDRITRKFTKEKSDLEKKVANLQKQIDSQLEAEKGSIQSAFEALPEAVRKLAPASNLDTAKNIAAVKRWLPNAAELVKSVTGKPGNSAGFRPLDTKPEEKEEDVVAKAKQHSIYSSF